MCKKTAVILAGGKGTRLRPYTLALPKPLVPICNKPILEIIIIQLKKCGFERIIITVNHQADIIMAYFGDGSKWDINIEYSLEDIPLGTMGPLKLIKNLPEDFLVMNGDVLTDLDFSCFLTEHIQEQSPFSISAYRRIQKNDYGVLIEQDGILTQFYEKPQTDFLVSMGVYAVSRKVLGLIPDHHFYGFDHLMRDMLSKKDSVRVFEHEGYWMDIGRPDDYEQASNDVETGTFTY